VTNDKLAIRSAGESEVVHQNVCLASPINQSIKHLFKSGTKPIEYTKIPWQWYQFGKRKQIEMINGCYAKCK